MSFQRRAAALRAHIAAGGPEGEVAGPILARLIEQHPELDQVDEPEPTAEVNLGYLKDLALQLAGLVARHCGVEIFEYQRDGRVKSYSYEGPEALVEFAAGLFRQDKAKAEQLARAAYLGHLVGRYRDVIRSEKPYDDARSTPARPADEQGVLMSTAMMARAAPSPRRLLPHSETSR